MMTLARRGAALRVAAVILTAATIGLIVGAGPGGADDNPGGGSVLRMTTSTTSPARAPAPNSPNRAGLVILVLTVAAWTIPFTFAVTRARARRRGGDQAEGP